MIFTIWFLDMIFTARQLQENVASSRKNFTWHSLTWQKHLTPSAAIASGHFWENLVVRTSLWTSSNLSMMAWLLEWLMWPGSLNRSQFATVLSRAVSWLHSFSTYSMQPCSWMPFTAMTLASMCTTELMGESLIFAGSMPNPESPSSWHGIFCMQTIVL